MATVQNCSKQFCVEPKGSHQILPLRQIKKGPGWVRAITGLWKLADSGITRAFPALALRAVLRAFKIAPGDFIPYILVLHP